MEAYLDDNVVIPDYINAMSREQIEKEIERLEAEAKKEREMLAAKKNSKMA